MKLHRFIGDFDFSPSEILVTDRELIHQVTRVLRLREGDRIILQNQEGREALAEISDQTDRALYLKILKEEANRNDPERETALYCAILKKENFELVAQKATEVGVMRIVPVITDRTVKTGLNMERLETIVREAAEQSGRASVPEISEPLSWSEAVRDAERYQEKYLFHMDGEAFSPEESDASRAIFIGPEGGWSEKELQEAKDFSIVSLGRLTFRGETAAIIASYLASQ